MLYLLALVGLVTVIVLMWKAFGPNPANRTPVRGVRGPDDDPEFLWNVGRQTRRPGTEEPDSPTAD